MSKPSRNVGIKQNQRRSGAVFVDPRLWSLLVQLTFCCVSTVGATSVHRLASAENHRFRFLAWPRRTRFGFPAFLWTIGSVRSSSVCHAQQHCFRHSATCPDVIDRETGRETIDSQNRHLHDHQRVSWAVLHTNDHQARVGLW